MQAGSNPLLEIKIMAQCEGASDTYKNNILENQIRK